MVENYTREGIKTFETHLVDMLIQISFVCAMKVPRPSKPNLDSLQSCQGLSHKTWAVSCCVQFERYFDVHAFEAGTELTHTSKSSGTSMEYKIVQAKAVVQGRGRHNVGYKRRVAPGHWRRSANVWGWSTSFAIHQVFAWTPRDPRSVLWILRIERQ